MVGIFDWTLPGTDHIFKSDGFLRLPGIGHGENEMRLSTKILLSAALLSCSIPTSKERLRYVNLHPETGEAIKKAILRGDVIVGMTKFEVYASWGGPREKGISAEKNWQGEYWRYIDMQDYPLVLLYFDGDHLSKIRKLKEPPAG